MFFRAVAEKRRGIQFNAQLLIAFFFRFSVFSPTQKKILVSAEYVKWKENGAKWEELHRTCRDWDDLTRTTKGVSRRT